jgi:DNA segregation ATPase FtsK/SpoIIIE, S-DNA-T family
LRLFGSTATAEFVSPPRLPRPVFETADVVVTAPQEVTRQASPNLMARILPVIMAVAMVGTMAVVFYARSPATRNPAFMMFPLTMLVSTAATVFAGADRRRGEINAERAEYLSYLSDVRGAAIKTAAVQHYSLMLCHPDPDTLWTLAGGCRMWERRVADPDFGHVRIGVGTLPLATRLIPPAIGSVRRFDPLTVTAMGRLVRTHSTVPGVPIVLALRDLRAVDIGGDTERSRALLRAVICQLAVMHSPTVVLVAAAVSECNRFEWDWLKWLPHNRHPRAVDDLGSTRMVYASPAEAKTGLADLTTELGPGDQSAPHVVLVVDMVGGSRWATDNAASGMTVLTIQSGNDDSAGPGVPRLRVSASEVVASSSNDDDEVHARPDEMSYIAAVTCAQRLAGYRACGADTSAAVSGRMGWQDLVGIDDVACYSPADRWDAKSPRDRLRIPIGTTVAGAPVELDIKEAAEGGMGPHGLCIGATGSGKSEFLRTVALGMMACHSPQELNLILVDFKGGATFSGLEPASHVAAVITNLSDKAPLVSRMRDALAGEMNRRQEVLRAAGNLDGIATYQRRWRAGAALDPLPALFIIVDEFSELLSQHPDFADVFAAIGRLGRSLGMHLLLASQRLDEGRLRGLESHLSYRVCLKTLSINESRMVLGTSDAYELPAAPGAGYLRIGTDELVRFQTAYVSGPCEIEKPSTDLNVALSSRAARSVPVRLLTTEPVGLITLAGSAETDVVEHQTVLQAVVERLSGYGSRAHEVWLPPLGAAPTLNSVFEDAEPMPALTIPIGVVDRPFEQRRTPLIVDLTGAAGNVAVVGAPQSGKSTALRTLITALAATHDPSAAQFYCLDFGGGTLASLRDWPHVGSVAGRTDLQLARRMIAQMEAIMRSRATLFREHGIESMVRYRQLKAGRDPLCDRFGDVFLVIDGWSALQRDFDTVETSVTALAAEGLSFGVHVVISASRWAEIRPALRDQVGTRIELRLGDPADSELDRRRAADVPEGKPGRGLSHDGLHMVVAVPGIGDSNLRHDGWAAPPIPLLPSRVDHDGVVERADVLDGGLLIGLEETELRPVAIDFARQLHLLILGDSECGKTATLRAICRELSRTTTAAQSQLFVVDLRRSLLGVVESQSGLLGGYLGSTSEVGAVIPRLTDRLRRRMPPTHATPMQLRTRSWWSGPEIYVVIDDYDLVVNAGVNPLAPLMDVLPHARDVGLHLVVARRSGGAARAMFEPLLAALRDAGCMTLLMSGNPDEGVTIGSVRMSPMPPGRAALITRHGDPQLVQVAWSDPL